MPVIIESVSYVLPSTTLSNEALSLIHPEWPIEKIYNKTGIKNRHISAPNEYSLELAIQVGKKLIKEHGVDVSQIDFVIFCSQTPKQLVPTNACIVQHELGLPVTAGALDINQGCSGYVSCLMLAEGLINSKRAKKVLLITSDTYTKLIDPDDRSLRTILGDAATASLIGESIVGIGTQDFVFGTDGSGAGKIIAQNSGVYGLAQCRAYRPDFYMDGSGVLNFTLGTVPMLVDNLLEQANLCLHDIDLFIFHQANAYLLENMRRKIGIAKERFFVYLEEMGNTGSSSIPIALHEVLATRGIRSGNKVMLVGFGAGLSWCSCLINWQ